MTIQISSQLTWWSICTILVTKSRNKLGQTFKSRHKMILTYICVLDLEKKYRYYIDFKRWYGPISIKYTSLKRCWRALILGKQFSLQRLRKRNCSASIKGNFQRHARSTQHSVMHRNARSCAPPEKVCGPEMEPCLRVTGQWVTGSAIWVRVGSGHGSKLWPGFLTRLLNRKRMQRMQLSASQRRMPWVVAMHSVVLIQWVIHHQG